MHRPQTRLRTALLCLLPAAPAFGQTGPAVPQNPTPAPAATGPDYSGDLLGDLAGLRPALAAHGITLGLTDLNEGFGNPTGGLRQGAIFEGLGEAMLQVDTGAAFHLPGGSMEISAFAIYGRGLSFNDLDNLQTVSSAEADRSVKLFEAWYEQSFVGGKVTLRVGQQAADQEFTTSQYAALFINAGFGFVPLNAFDLPGGGPAYPLGTPAVRLKVQPAANTTVLLALFNGDPAPRRSGDPQKLDGSGTSFNLDGGALVFAELQRAINQSGSGLPGTYKLGMWYHSGSFPDQQQDNAGNSLASPQSTGVPRGRLRNWSVYAVADQLLWRQAAGSASGIGAFVRAMGAPGDRNPIDVFVDAGLNWQAPLGRAKDTAGIGLGWVRIGDTARLLDAETAFYTGNPAYPRRGSEALVELTYQATLRPWFQVQPDFQYVFDPGGGIPNPLHPTERLRDEAVIGVRTNLTF